MKKSCLSLVLSACLFSGLAYAEEKVYNAEKIADIFYALNGDPKDPQRKVNHAKGFCTHGSFIPAKGITSKIDIPLFNQKSIPTQVRYSLGGAHMSDKTKPRGMALKMMGDNDSWTMVMLNTEINFAKNPQEFGQFFEMRIPVNGKPDVEKIKRLTKEVDSYRNFEEYVAKTGVTGSVANIAFYSIHTFMVKDKKTGKMLPAKWKFVPVDGVKYLSETELKNKGDHFLEEDFKAYAKNKPVEYKMYLIYANKGDVIDNTTVLWKGKHKEEFVGTLKVSEYEGNGCNGDVYFPNEIPEGVGAPTDPLFEVRNEAYAITFSRRQ